VICMWEGNERSGADAVRVSSTRAAQCCMNEQELLFCEGRPVVCMSEEQLLLLHCIHPKSPDDSTTDVSTDRRVYIQ
jgi:hypothetical protein